MSHQEINLLFPHYFEVTAGSEATPPHVHYDFYRDNDHSSWWDGRYLYDKPHQIISRSRTLTRERCKHAV